MQHECLMTQSHHESSLHTIHHGHDHQDTYTRTHWQPSLNIESLKLPLQTPANAATASIPNAIPTQYEQHVVLSYQHNPKPQKTSPITNPMPHVRLHCEIRCNAVCTHTQWWQTNAQYTANSTKIEPCRSNHLQCQREPLRARLASHPALLAPHITPCSPNRPQNTI